MRVRSVARSVLVLAAVVLICGAVQAAGQKSSPGGAAYKVTAWPANVAGTPYSELFETYLNEMASQGWLLHDDVSRNGAAMLVFTRRLLPQQP